MCAPKDLCMLFYIHYSNMHKNREKKFTQKLLVPTLSDYQEFA